MTRAPIDPDEARRLLQEELTRPEYEAARPSWFDVLADAVRQWFADLLSGAQLPGGGPFVVALLVAVAVVVGLAILVWGVPRGRGRAGGPRTGIFAGSLATSAAEHRAEAERAEAAGDWATAIAERFRAVARSLDERALLRVWPGMTAGEVARRAAGSFPAERQALATAADGFDRVRYVGETGDEDTAAELARLDARLLATAPAEVAG